MFCDDAGLSRDTGNNFQVFCRGWKKSAKREKKEAEIRELSSKRENKRLGSKDPQIW